MMMMVQWLSLVGGGVGELRCIVGVRSDFPTRPHMYVRICLSCIRISSHLSHRKGHGSERISQYDVENEGWSAGDNVREAESCKSVPGLRPG